jgi:anti-sigma factor ChrR (cupin superfamily)
MEMLVETISIGRRRHTMGIRVRNNNSSSKISGVLRGVQMFFVEI